MAHLPALLLLFAYLLFLVGVLLLTDLILPVVGTPLPGLPVLSDLVCFRNLLFGVRCCLLLSFVLLLQLLGGLFPGGVFPLGFGPLLSLTLSSPVAVVGVHFLILLSGKFGFPPALYLVPVLLVGVLGPGLDPPGAVPQDHASSLGVGWGEAGDVLGPWGV